MLGHEGHEWHTYFWSLGFTLIGAALFALTRNAKHHRVPQEALIGIVYVVAAAAGLLLLSRSAEGNEELRRLLIGDILLVTPKEVLGTFGIFAAIGAVHFVFRKQFIQLSFAPEKAEADGMAMHWWDFIFYALFGLVVTTFLQIGGVLLVLCSTCTNRLRAAYGHMAYGVRWCEAGGSFVLSWTSERTTTKIDDQGRLAVAVKFVQEVSVCFDVF